MDAIISRSVPLTDVEVKGRMVTAYAAVFNSPTEIRDNHGHYREDIARTAFSKAIRETAMNAGVFYNHGMTIHGTPSDLYSIPLGVPMKVSADNKGLLTVSRFNKTATADAVLEAINDGGVKGYSFTGKIVKSNPERVPRAKNGELPRITRTELGLREYGPTPFPAYTDAEIVSVRSLALAGGAPVLSDKAAAEILYQLLMRTTQPNEPDAFATPTGAGAAEPGTDTHSERNRIVISDLITRSGVRKWHPTSSATVATDGQST